MLLTGVLDAMVTYAVVARYFEDIPLAAPDHYLVAAQHIFMAAPAPNRLELSCRGTTLTARINGETVAMVSHNTFAEGRLWIGAGEQGAAPDAAPGPVARFSNLVIRQE